MSWILLTRSLGIASDIYSYKYRVPDLYIGPYSGITLRTFYVYTIIR